MRILLALLISLLPAALQAKATVARPALWKVSDADTTIWLFGTIHLLRPGIDWLRGPVAKAFTHAGELVVETEIPEPPVAQQAIMATAYDLSGPPLAAKLPAALNERLDAQMTAYGLPGSVYARADTWYAAVMLESIAYQKLGLVSEGGVDLRLLADAKKAGKRIVPLEGFQEQLGLFDSLDQAEQIQMLKSTLDEIGDSEKHINILVDSWTHGDEAVLERAINEDMDDLPKVRALLIDQRNDRFAAWIAKRLDTPGAVFVAVGAGHLGGKHNIRALLETKGLKVERVQ